MFPISISWNFIYSNYFSNSKFQYILERKKERFTENRFAGFLPETLSKIFVTLLRSIMVGLDIEAAKETVRFEMKNRHKRSTKEKATGTQKTKEENEKDLHPAAHMNCGAEFRSLPAASARTVHRVRARPFHSFPPRTRYIFPVTRSGEVRKGDDILRARVLRART